MGDENGWRRRFLDVLRRVSCYFHNCSFARWVPQMKPITHFAIFHVFFLLTYSFFLFFSRVAKVRTKREMSAGVLRKIRKKLWKSGRRTKMSVYLELLSHLYLFTRMGLNNILHAKTSSNYVFLTIWHLSNYKRILQKCNREMSENIPNS